MRINKILAFVITLTMVISVIVMPVNAASVNLAGEITGITDDVVSHTAAVKASDEAESPDWKLSNATAVYSDGVVKVTRTSGDSSGGLRLAYAPLQSGKTYYVEGYFRADSLPDSNKQIRFYLSNPDTSQNKADITGIAASGESSTVTSYVYPQNTTDWVKSSGTFTVGTKETGTEELGLHLGIKVGSNANASSYTYSVKDIRLYEVKAFTGTAEANGSTGAVFTFANDIKTAADENFTVTSSDSGAAAPAIALETSENVCTVSLSDYSWDTAYTITANGLTDMFGQTLSEPVSVTVTTPKKPANIAGEITGIESNTISHTAVVKASVDASAPDWVITSGATAVYEDGAVKVTARAASDASSGLVLKNLGVESGKTYYVSAQVRCDQAPTTKESYYARLYMSNIDATNNKAVIPTGIDGVSEISSVTQSVDIVTNGGWQTLSSVFTVGADDGTKELGLNLGIKVGANANSESFLYSVKNVTVYELTALDIDGSYMAKLIDGEDDTVTLYITTPNSSTEKYVYLFAASYEGGALKDVELGKRKITDSVRDISVKAGDNYKIMIWDSNLKPLCTAFYGSDI